MTTTAPSLTPSPIGTSTDRARVAMETLLELLLPRLVYLAQWEYTVIDTVPGPPIKMDLLPVAADNPFGPLSQVPLWPGPGGAQGLPAIGSKVLVRFNDGDPGKPTVCAWDPTTPIEAQLFATQVQLGSAAAVPAAKAPPLVTMMQSLSTWSAAVAAALSSAGFPIAPAQGAFVGALSTAEAATPATLVDVT